MGKRKRKDKGKNPELKDQGMYWMFTWWDMNTDPLTEFKYHKMKYNFLHWQLERCPETDRLHYQGYVCFKSNQRLSALKKLNETTHWDYRIGDHQQAYDYVTKEDTRVSYEEAHNEFLGCYHIIDEGDEKSIPRTRGERMDLRELISDIKKGDDNYELLENHPTEYFKFYKHVSHVKEVFNEHKWKLEPSKLDRMTFRPWQRDVYEKLMLQNDRKILWVVDGIGNTGKSIFGKLLQKKHEAFLVTSMSEKHVAYAYNGQGIIVFDLTRDSYRSVNYTMLEHFKDGNVFVDHYESKNKHVPEDVKVLVLSNFEPEQEKLSSDRWEIFKITESMINFRVVPVIPVPPRDFSRHFDTMIAKVWNEVTNIVDSDGDENPCRDTESNWM